MVGLRDMWSLLVPRVSGPQGRQVKVCEGKSRRA